MNRAKLLGVGLWITCLITAVSVKSQINIVRPGYTNPASAQALYQNHCASCHGQDMKGEIRAQNVLPRALPDLTLISHRNSGTFPSLHVYEAIAGREHAIVGQDRTDMPGWSVVFHQMYMGDEGKERQAIYNLVTLIESKQMRN